MLCPALESKKNMIETSGKNERKTVRIKQMLWGKGWSCTPGSGRAKAAQRCSQSGRLFPWQSSETRNQQARPSFSQANQHQVPDFPLYLQQSIYVHGQNHTEVEHVLLHLSKHRLYFFMLGQTVMYWAVLSQKFILVIFLDCLAVLAITQLYQHILEAWRTCREAWGCLLEIEISWRFGWRRYVCPEV